MGILSLYFAAVVAFHVPFIRRGHYATGYEGPCQPFKENQTRLCDELQAFVQLQNGASKFCNNSIIASCYLDGASGLRKDAVKWRNCYCDEMCEKIGDCCVDYDFRHAPRLSTRIVEPRILTCRRAPSDIKHFPFGFYMVGRCPPHWSDAKTANGCTSTNYSADPLTALPVLDITSNITYANTYCALCHGRSQNLLLWAVKIYSSWYSSHLQQVTLQDVESPGTMWEAVPLENAMPERCVLTPSEAYTEPDTKIKQLCRSYANGIQIGRTLDVVENFKSPHCAILEGYNISAATHIICSKGQGGGGRPLLSATLFTFSGFAKTTKIQIFDTKTVRVRFNCSSSEVYDPFKDRCLPVQVVSSPVRGNDTNKTEEYLCRGPRYSSEEFRVFSNNSILLLPHQTIYPNGSYILVNRSLILCSNFSRNYTKRIDAAVAEKETPPGQSFTAVHIITYVGFSLSIIFLVFLLVTYFLFAELRTYPGKRVMHLSCAMIAMQSVFFASDAAAASSAVCAVVGALLHFFILASFLWMSAIAHNTQTTFSTMDVNPTNPVVIAKRRKVYIRDSLFCWVSSLVVVGICVALQLTSTGNVGYSNEGGCQLSLPARTYAVTCPISLTLGYNIIALIRTAIAIKTQSQGNAAATNQRSLALIVAKLTVVMGITWILGVLLAFYPTPYIEYPFIIVNSCQGVVISLSFVFKKNVFALYKQRFMTETHPQQAAAE